MGWFQNYFVNEGGIKLFVFIWLLANITVFSVNWVKFSSDKYAYLRLIVGDGLAMARGAANVLNLNSALVLLPVCRNLVNFTRGCFEGRRSIRRLFDKNITFHKLCAYAICFAAVFHIGAHIFNVQRIINTEGGYHRVAADESWEDVLFTSVPGFTGVLITLSLIIMVSTAAEQVRRSYFELFWYTHHLFLVFYGALCFHGYTGFVERQLNFAEAPPGCLPRDATSSVGCTRLICADCCATEAEIAQDTEDNCCPCIGRPDNPIYARGGPGSYLWLVGPLSLYLCERIYRLFMSYFRPLKILKVIKHHDSTPVIELQIQKVKTVAGQYAFLHCPAVSKYEWHPFTLTSCPELDYISFHIRMCGDWTTGIAEACGFNCVTFRMNTRGLPNQETVARMLKVLWPKRRVHVVHVLGDESVQHTADVDFKSDELDKLRAHPDVDAASVTTDKALQPHLLPRVAIDGPFGTCSEDIHRFPAVVLVGAGIGVTPYASLLQDLYFRLSNPSNYQTHTKLKKVYFYWICPGFNAWGWFASLLMELEEKIAAIGREDFLSIRVYMTRGWSQDDAAKLMIQDEDNGDLIVRDDETGRALRSKMNFGRPMWEKDFEEFAINHTGENIGVFFCGPKVLSSQLHNHCNTFTNAGAGGTKFFYHKENF